MGQFFQSADRKYIDFMYKPNLELMEKVARESAKNKYLNAKLLDAVDDVKFDYLDYDSDLAKKKQDYYNQKVNEITKLASDSSNPNDYILKLKELQREVSQDFQQGEINNYYKNLKAKKEWENKLAQMTPEEQQMYGVMWDNYINKNKVNRENGEYGDIFKADQMYSIRKWEDEFLKSNHFKSLKAEMNADSIDNIGGKWIVRRGNKTQELSKDRVLQAWNAFAKENIIEDYARTMTKYRGDNDWFNEQGELDFEGGRIGRMGQDVANIGAYKNVLENSRHVQMNPDYKMNRQHQLTMARQTAAHTQKLLSSLPAGSQKINTERFKTMQSMIYTKNAFLNNIRGLGNSMKGIHDFDDALKKLESNKNGMKPESYEIMKKKILGYKQRYEDGMAISYAPLLNHMDAKSVTQFKKNLEENVNERGKHIAGFISVHTLPANLQQLIVNSGISLDNITPNQLEDVLSDYKVSIQKNSAAPQIVPELFNDPKAHSVAATLIFENDEGKTFTSDIFYPLTQVTGDEEILLIKNASR